MNQIIGIVLLGLAFAGPICAYRFCYAKDKDEGGGLVVFFAVLAACFIGFTGLAMVTGQ